jgi:hypothetical protein
MTPLDMAQALASDNAESRAYAVAMVARALSDDHGLRQGWPVETALPAAARHLHLDPAPALIAHARDLMPTISDAVLNRRPADGR